MKGSRIFSSVGKGLSDRRHAGRVLVAGSDSDEDSESDPAGRVLSRKLSFNKFRNSPRYVHRLVLVGITLFPHIYDKMFFYENAGATLFTSARTKYAVKMLKVDMVIRSVPRV